MSEDRKKRKKKKLAAIAIVATLMLGTGTAAFAYWTTTGTGTGSASTGSNSPVTVVQTSTVSNIRPGSAPQSLSGNFTNPNEGPVYITSVTASIASVTKAADAPTGTCSAGDYTLTGATMAVGRQIPAGTAQGSWTGATIAFNNKASDNQDACKNATVALTYTAN